MPEVRVRREDGSAAVVEVEDMRHYDHLEARHVRQVEGGDQDVGLLYRQKRSAS
jgi:hypothetical protein